MSYTPTGMRNFMAVLRRTMNSAWFGEDTSLIAKPPAILNNEFLSAVNAAGTGEVNMIGVNASNAVVVADGSVLVTREHVVKSGIAAAAATSQTIFVAGTTYQVTDFRLSFGTAGGSGATVTIEKLTGTTAPGSGTALLTAALVLTGTANTVLTGVLIATLSSLQLAAGDRIGLVFAGTQTGLADLSVNLALQRI